SGPHSRRRGRHRPDRLQGAGRGPPRSRPPHRDGLRRRFPARPEEPSAVIELDIMVEAGDWGAVADVEDWAQKAAEAALVATDRAALAFDASIMLTDDAQIRDLNREWRGKDRATNVLSFPAPEPPGKAGASAAGPRHLGD